MVVSSPRARIDLAPVVAHVAEALAGRAPRGVPVAADRAAGSSDLHFKTIE